MGQTQASLEGTHMAQLDNAIDGVVYTVHFECAVFSKGSCRLAFRGVYRGNGPKNDRACVTKIPCLEGRSNTAEDYAADIRASQKAEELASNFNQEFASSKPLTFVLPALATVLKVCETNRLVSPGDKILVEDFIEGKYEKFNNNTYYQSDEVATVPCFSHYTYYKTGGRYLVCDIQGVRTPKGYLLTDPAVHSKAGSGFGDTDLSQEGFMKFFSSHRCTSVCGQFPISDLKVGRDLPDKRIDATQKNYCGGPLEGPRCACCDGTCGPRNGCNCAGCMRKDIADFGLAGSTALVNREGAVSRLSYRNRKFYCGRGNMTRDKMTDGTCGPQDGNNCHACRQLDIQATGRYHEIVRMWYSAGKSLPVPSSVVVRNE